MSTNRMRGTELAITPAAICPYGISSANAPLRVATPSVTVFSDSTFRNVKANMNSFQENTKVRIPAVISAGVASGTTTVLNV
jgi:hypothetical protein